MRLSICIPTYNRAPELRQLLDTIASQAGHALDFDIVISDNASTDGTAEMVADYVGKGMPIHYHRAAENVGFDRNILKVVDLAAGEFCWLFGSDDLMEAGALAAIGDALQRYPEISAISVGSQGYNRDLAERIVVTDNIATQFNSETLLRGREEPVATIGPWMGYMTSLIVRRSLWQAGVRRANIEPYLRGYVHLYVAARMLEDRSTWLCLPQRVVGCRTGNDSYAGNDEFARTRLDIEGFDLAFGDVLGRDNWAYRRAMGMVADYFVRAHFFNAKAHGVSSAYWRKAIPLTVARYWRYPKFWVKALPVALTPRFIFMTVRAVRSRWQNGSTGIRA